MPGIFYLYTYPELRLVRWNHNHAILLGFEPGEMNQRSLFDWHPPQNRELVRQAIEVAMQRGHNAIEAHLLTKDGRSIPFLLTGLRLDLQGATYLIGTGTDLTQRRLAEAALERSEQNYREIFNSTNEAILLIDGTTGRSLDVNDAMLRLYGYDSKAEVLAKGAGDFSANDPFLTQAEADTRLRRAIEEGPQVFEWQARKKNGQLFWVEVSLRSSHVGGQGRILAVVRDITERKRAEADREKLQAQLTQAQKMESVGRLAGGVAHDFNNMLQAILGNVALALQDVPEEGRVHESLEEIRKCAERSADLTRQLLAFARKQAVVPRVLDLNATVEGMLKMLRRLIGEHIQLSWHPASALWHVKIDPSQIDQLLANLCVNARDSIQGTGSITIHTDNVPSNAIEASPHTDLPPGDYVLLTVADDGCGMDKEVLSHLFEPFFTTKTLGQGTGLGLATVYGIVQQNQGLIHVASESGRGSVFKVFLPRYVGEVAPPPSELIPRTAFRGHEAILLVEDEPAILRIGKRILERLGYAVLAANTPSEAISLAENRALEIHLLLTDIVMPEMSGRALAMHLLAFRPNLKCLFMSGYTPDVIALQGVPDDNMQFIEKPFTADALARKVRETLAC